MSDEIELSETAQAQWDQLKPQTRENLLIEFEVAIEDAYVHEPEPDVKEGA